MNLLAEFKEKFFLKTGIRGTGFLKMIEHLEEQRHKDFYIIETGTARVEGNWNGDGQSTLIWNWYSSKHSAIKVISIDIDQKAVETAKNQTLFVQYYCNDSVSVLNNLDRDTLTDTKLLYLDSFDLDVNNPEPSANHHLKELTAVYANLPTGCMIAVDDCLSPNLGKHVKVADFFDHLNIKPVFMEYQWLWIKP